MGAPAFAPTAEQRRMVHAMAGYGVPQDDIALVIGITSRTLRKHFRHELDVAVIEANTRVAQCLFKQATTPGNIGASIFWLKARAGWREKHPEPPAPPVLMEESRPIEIVIVDPANGTRETVSWNRPALEDRTHDA
ncbi:hypothetical protein EJV46_07855 [Roseococcus sp. SYP-B2431]|uniref:hypothetical protein n=1 Tax=Roseococcus sp. SYP-B2431 TaxID=2496640 RepID=UPI00103DEF33|nr:hypothetical protein [Roseococcus sp. SYP-B2431]TCH99225.1 hypothetical protein EJV46_07855 [Roseococcus sp. SYP-B2431]